MAKTPTAPPVQADLPSLSGKLMFYEKPEPLNKLTHAKLGLNNIDKPFQFVTTSHMVPVMVPEFAAAAVSYPIVFLGEPRRPVGIMGFSADKNLFVDERFGIEPDAYLPLFVRRYPFAFATDENNPTQQMLIIDTAARQVAENAERPLFENGEPTPMVEDIIKFCTDFEQARMATDVFCNKLEELDLFEQRTVKFNPQNPDGSDAETITLAEYWAVSDEKVRALPDAELLELARLGALNRIYAHLTSLNVWERLLAKALTRPQPAQAAVN